MYYKIPGTLDHLRSAPQFHKQDLSKILVPTVMAQYDSFFGDTVGMANPGHDAVEFYVMNHLVAQLEKRFARHQKLPDWAVPMTDHYLKVILKQFPRLFYYMAMIVTREARHGTYSNTGNGHSIVLACGAEVSEFIHQITNKNEDTAVAHLRKHPPACTLGQYFSAMAYFFEHGGFGGSYGGTPWANIARCALQMVQGKTTIEMMVDTSYTLAHNGGPMFNKGMLYQPQHNKSFLELLDIQRAGQTPSAVLAGLGQTGSHPDCGMLTDFIMEVREKLGGIEFYVDWFKVEACMGSLKGERDYKHHQKMQIDAGHAPGKSIINGKVLDLGEGWDLGASIEFYPGGNAQTLVRKPKASDGITVSDLTLTDAEGNTVSLGAGTLDWGAAVSPDAVFNKGDKVTLSGFSSADTTASQTLMVSNVATTSTTSTTLKMVTPKSLSELLQDGEEATNKILDNSFYKELVKNIKPLDTTPENKVYGPQKKTKTPYNNPYKV